MKKNIKRILENRVKHALENMSAIWINGPKWCGKTYLGEEISKSAYYVQEIDKQNETYFSLGKLKIDNPIFDGPLPRLIDEWQLIPKIWDYTRYLIDQNKNKPNMFILTGSSKPKSSEINHSGAGRIGFITLSTLTFAEIINAKEWISLKDLFEDPKLNMKELTTKEYDLNWTIKTLLKGGWPIVHSENRDHKIVIDNYVNSILNTDLKEVAGVNADRNLFSQLLKSVSRLNTSVLKQSTILNDIKNKINEKTLYKYMNILESTYVIDYLEPWSVNSRSKTAIRTSPKMYLCDPSIGLNVLGFKNESDLLKDLNTLGIYFENQVIKDLKVYAEYLDGKLYYYQNKNGFEIDAILSISRYEWAAIEIKLGTTNLDKAARDLIKFANLYEIKPKFLMIIYGGDISYVREDGVLVVPHTLLKP